MPRRYWPERVERLTGVPQRDIVAAARTLGLARNAIVLTARGAEQQSQGVANVLSFINLALALGRVGRPFNGYGCLTGQGNGQGGREHGQKADQLPGYRRLDDAAARERDGALVGSRARGPPGSGPLGVRAARLARSRRRRARPARDRLESGRLGAACHTHRRAARARSTSSSSAISSCPKPRGWPTSSCRRAQWAEEDGTMTNLEGRVLRRRQRRRAAARAFAPTCEILSGLASALGSARSVSGLAARRVRRAAARDRRRAGRLLRHHAGAHRSRAAACSGRARPPRRQARRASSPIASPRRTVERASTASARSAPAERPDADYPFYLTTGRVLAQYQSGTQTRRVERLSQPRRSRTRRCTRARRSAPGFADGAEITIETRRGRASFRLRTSPGIREDTDLRAVPLARTSSRRTG